MVRMKQTDKGFTLVETILASVILCGAVLAVGAISTRSLGGAKLNRQYEVAAALVDRQLCLIDYIGVDNLYLVYLTVSWVESNRLYSISVDTRLNGTRAVLETEE